MRDDKKRNIKRILEKEEQDMEDKFSAIGFIYIFFSSFFVNCINRPNLAKSGRQITWCADSAL